MQYVHRSQYQLYRPGSILEENLDSKLLNFTKLAFTADHLWEEIEGSALYQEKYFKEKIRTLTVALVICLNIDIDPPDVQRIPPYSRVQAWFDPTDANNLRALETIGKNLQAQYERWQPRARYKQCLDPTLDDVKRLCINLRRNAKEDRILFHYNGHGVPRPTTKGEIWVFNSKFTKYIPLSLADLQRWLGAPSVYVIDCQNSGRVIKIFESICHRRTHEGMGAQERQPSAHPDLNRPIEPGLPPGPDGVVSNVASNSDNYSHSSTMTLPGSGQPQSGVVAPPVTMENTIMLAACQESQDIPQNADLPADVFTACLTTPIRMAIRWHWLRHQKQFPGFLDEALLDRIPGSHSNRMSLLGEINWIFTAVTDTIAWCSFPVDLFQKLFRQDLLVASLFRNFLLAERIMNYYGCQPMSSPPLIPTFRHSMWDAWDHELDRIVHYLPRILKLIQGTPNPERKLPIIFAPVNNQRQNSGNKSNSNGHNHNNTLGEVNRMAVHPLNEHRPLASTGGPGPPPPTTTQNAHSRFNIAPSNNHNTVGPLMGGMKVIQTTTQLTGAVSNLPNTATSQLHQPGEVRNLPGRPNTQSQVIVVVDENKVDGPPGFLKPPMTSNVSSAAKSDSKDLLQPTGCTAAVSANANKPGNGIALPERGYPQNADLLVTKSKTTTTFIVSNIEQSVNSPRAGLNDASKLTKIYRPSSVVGRLPSANETADNSIETLGDSSVDDDIGDSSLDEDDDNDETISDDGSMGTDDRLSKLAVSLGNLLPDRPIRDRKFRRSCPSIFFNRIKFINKSVSSEAQPLAKDKPVAQAEALPSNVHPSTSTQAEQSERILQDTITDAHHKFVPPVLADKKSVQPLVTDLVNSAIAQPEKTTLPLEPSQSSTLRRQPHAADKLYALQAPGVPVDSSRLNLNLACGPGLPEEQTLHITQKPPVSKPFAPLASHISGPTNRLVSHRGDYQKSEATTLSHSTGPIVTSAGSAAMGVYDPTSFFISQMTAFKVWLQTANEKRSSATQLPILLQILLSQSHRIRAMKLLTKFLDLGPWAVVHCLTVGILPYIVRLFHSPVLEVKPHLVFIWGKIIASAQTEFGQNESVREFGYKYFITCLGDSVHLTPLIRTITAFALAKMLEKEPDGEPDAFFQEAYLKQNFLPLVLSQLSDNPPTAPGKMMKQMRLWMIFALAKLWRQNDEARWFAMRLNVPETLFPYLQDIFPEVRAATVYAFGSLADNHPSDILVKDRSNQVNHQIIIYLVKTSTHDSSPLVRCELVAALAGMVREFETQLCAVGSQYMDELYRRRVQRPTAPSHYFSVSGHSRGFTKQNVTSWLSLLNRAQCPDRLTEGTVDTISLSQRPTSVRSIFYVNSENVYVQLWSALVLLSNDPYPKCGRMALVIMNFLLSKICETQPIVGSRQSISYSPLSSDGRIGCDVIDNKHESDLNETIPQSSSQGTVFYWITQKAHVNQEVIVQGEFASALSPSDSPDLESTADVPIATIHRVNDHPGSLKAIPINSPQFSDRRQNQTGHQSIIPIANDYNSPASFGRDSKLDQKADHAPCDTDPLASVKTDFFAWSCRWFTRPVLSYFHDQHESVDTNANDCLFPGPNCDLAALTSVSTDPVAVSYSDRIARLTLQRDHLRRGRLQWCEAVSRTDQSDSNFLTVNGSNTGLNDRLRSGNSHTSFTPPPGQLQPRALRQMCCPDEPTLIRFHPFQPHLVVSDQRGGVTVCSTNNLDRLNYIKTPRLHGPSVLYRGVSLKWGDDSGGIKGLELINISEERGLLLTAHTDSRIRIWRNYVRDLGQDSEIVTAWTGLPAMSASTKPVCTAVHWSQSTSQLAVAGDVEFVRLWDCEYEMKLRDVLIDPKGCVCALGRNADQNLLAAGLRDGSIHIFDTRVPSHQSPQCKIFSTATDCGSIQAIGFSEPGDRLYAVGCSGSVASWSLTCAAEPSVVQQKRKSSYTPSSNIQFRRLVSGSIKLSTSSKTNALFTCADLKLDSTSPNTHLLAVGACFSTTREVRLHHLNDGSLHSHFKNHSGHFQRETVGFPTCIAIHPVEKLIAVGMQEQSMLLLRVENKLSY